MPLKFPKPTSRAEAKWDKANATRKAWLALRRQVLERDGHRCRVCASRQQVEVHHIRFRSTGGTHTMSNCAALCARCHGDVHGYRLVLRGDANGTLTVTRTA